MGLPSSSVTPFLISIYKDSKTLLMLLMKSSNFSTAALPGNEQARGRGLHQNVWPVSSLHAPGHTQRWAEAHAWRFLSSWSIEDKQRLRRGRREAGRTGRWYLRPLLLLGSSCLCSQPTAVSPSQSPDANYCPQCTPSRLLSVCRGCSELPLHAASCPEPHVSTQSLCPCTFPHAG